MKKLVLALALVALVLTGCFEVKEDLWVNKDGSGRLKIAIGTDRTANPESPTQKTKSEAKRKATKEKLEADPNVSKVEITVAKGDDGLEYETTDISLKDVTKVGDALAKARTNSNKDEADVFTVTKLENGNYAVLQTLGKKVAPKESPAPKTEDEKKMEEGMKKQLVTALGEHKLTIQIHGPAIVSSNGKSDGTTSTHELKLAKLVSDDSGAGVEIKAEVSAK